MPPCPVIDLSTIDLTSVVADKEGVRKSNPQRYEMEQLDGIIHLDEKNGLIVGFKDVRPDEFWVRGHIPGRPLMPGVLMIEAAAQLASFYIHAVLKPDWFVGFGGVDGVKFRSAVVPPCRLILAGKALKVRRRRSVFAVQGFVDGEMAFESEIAGIAV